MQHKGRQSKRDCLPLTPSLLFTAPVRVGHPPCCKSADTQDLDGLFDSATLVPTASLSSLFLPLLFSLSFLFSPPLFLRIRSAAQWGTKVHSPNTPPLHPTPLQLQKKRDWGCGAAFYSGSHLIWSFAVVVCWCCLFCLVFLSFFHTLNTFFILLQGSLYSGTVRLQRCL